MSQITIAPGSRLGAHRLGPLRARWRIGDAYEATLNGAPRLILTLAVRTGQIEPFLRWGEQEIKRCQGLPAEILVPKLTGYTHGNLGWICFAPFDGLSLRQQVQAEGALPDDQALILGIALAELLVAAHGQGVALGSVRPTMILTEPSARLLSVGIERGLSPLLKVPPKPVRRYRAPEQDAPTATGDIYALGAVLWYALTGKKPPRSKPGHLPTPPSWESPDGGAAAALLDPLVLRMLAPRPQERPRSAAALLTELRAIAEVVGLPPGARTILGLPPHREPFRRADTDPNLLFELLSSATLEELE